MEFFSFIASNKKTHLKPVRMLKLFVRNAFRFGTPLLVLLMMSVVSCGQTREKSYSIVCIGFYNLENLLDTIDSEDTNDKEFTPDGFSNWNTEKYNKKLLDLSEVIAQIGTDVNPDGPAVLGVTEVENLRVLEDLVNTPLLKQRKYRIVHYDSPDRRGIDVALLYQPKYFKPTTSIPHHLYIADKPEFRSRDQLLVSGILDGEEMHFIVNHWPSRSGGEKASRPLRNAAGDLSRAIIDSILKVNPHAKIVLMGDLNDDPVDPSVKNHLRAHDDLSLSGNNDLYNPYLPLFRKGIGSLAWQDSWNLFDQIILSPALTGDDYLSYKFYKAKVFNKPFLQQKSGAFQGYPFRTLAGGTYLGGYSDHFPVYIFLIREK